MGSAAPRVLARSRRAAAASPSILDEVRVFIRNLASLAGGCKVDTGTLE
jgi:hypothetical protein